MSTNYYIDVNKCDCCGRFEEVHIGKKSAGWEFMFQSYNTLRSWQAWKQFLTSQKIYDEYEREVEYDDFVRKVETSLKGTFNGRMNKNHYDEGKGKWNQLDEWKDKEGYSFTSNEFS